MGSHFTEVSIVSIYLCLIAAKAYTRDGWRADDFKADFYSLDIEDLQDFESECWHWSGQTFI